MDANRPSSWKENLNYQPGFNPPTIQPTLPRTNEANDYDNH